ncbi:hypothetical protein Plav_1628 [Parvibaculum lavamentivorans DS-1]|uniref:VWFA domain-containing protein n=1 Tax=Parvibaculum lavamentivorans (strain DS-1 / DSM 13023 / NCIMB 13966) TaxID=402881 RepID=A7HTL4_PARL1|nr:hypothetical protein [Parvibaculum lavamentivorans]ABS63247.1 hypothetical protein Plav_1628 [Parvibaculum lavamentivorans DS-1]
MFRLAALALFALVPIVAGPAAAVDAPARPQTVIVGLDLSKSNPLVMDAAYAARVGQRTADELDTLPVRSRIMLRTFGSYDSSANALKIDEVISSRAKPETVAEGIGALISAMPKLVGEGKLKAQGYTNIVSFLETTSQLVDCEASDVRIILLTDGFEDSEYAKLAGGGSLPRPQALYPGCAELMMLGVGQGGGSPTVTKRVSAQWQGWAEAAGFRKFTGLYDW